MIRSLLNGYMNGGAKALGALRCIAAKRKTRVTEEKRPNREQLFVRLCGSIDKCPDRMANGSLIVPLATKNAHDDSHTNHRVYMPSSILKNHPENQIVEGKRIYITGFIGYKDIKNDEGNVHATAQINANKVLVCAESDNSSSDVNDVKLYGYVISKPDTQEKVTTLQVATEVFDPREQRYKNNVHQVWITEDDEVQQRAMFLDIGTGVYIHGHLKTELARKQGSILRLSYYIRPSKLIVCQPKMSNFEFEEY